MSHDKMPTFFSGTDTSTLQKEGTDRNNFVSLIVNNDGTYSAAITRKVEYTEKHEIEITGKYPFFGTKRIYEIPSVYSKDEKKKTVVEWFDLVVEKHPAIFQPDEYDLRFNEIAAKKINRQYPVSKYSDIPYYQRQNQHSVSGFNTIEDDEYDDYDGLYEPASSKTLQLPASKSNIQENASGSISNPFDNEVFDAEFVQEALSMPSLLYKVQQLLLEVLTGCPIITNWIRPTDANNALFESILEKFHKAGYTEDVYQSFVYNALTDRFVTIEPEDYFPKYALEDGSSAYMLENILTVKLISMVSKLQNSKLVEAVIGALTEFYSL